MRLPGRVPVKILRNADIPDPTRMSNIINLQRVRRERRQAKADGLTLCQSGFHKWQAVPEQRFDVRQGKLVTMERCRRCDAERIRLT